MSIAKINSASHDFLDGNPVFCSIMLLGASISNRATKVIKAIPHFFQEENLKQLYMLNTRDVLVKVADYRNNPEDSLKTLFDGATSEKQLLERYTRINKQEVSPDLLFSTYRKSLGANTNSLCELVLKDLPEDLLSKALNMAVRYNKIKICKTFFEQDRYRHSLELDNIDSLNKVLHISIKNESTQVLEFLIENTQARLCLKNPKYVHNILNTCTNEHLKDSLTLLNKYSLNLLECEDVINSDYITEIVPNMKEEFLSQQGNMQVPEIEEDIIRRTKV